jgi:2-oxoisovalerate dehydrogenase E1 component alpha subunit
MTQQLTADSPTSQTWAPLERSWTSSDHGPIQFVTPTGELTELGAAYGVDTGLAQTLYRDMARARRLDQEALALQRQGELGLWLQCWGQEAAQVGTIRALSPKDYVFPAYREHAAALARGVTPAELLAQWRGVNHAGWDPGAYNFHFYSLVLGTQTLHATGFAMGSVLEGGDQVVAAYFGDGAASQGDVSEALNWSAAGNLPVLFICQNNQWAISTPTELQYRTPVHQRAAGFGLRVFHVDGNDALATYAVTSEAAALTRRGEGPALVEAETFRMAGHSTSDDPSRYRSEDEITAWQSRDPLVRLEVLLRSMDTPAEFFSDLEDKLEHLALDVRRACRALPEPALDELFGHAYTASHGLVEAERLAHREFVKLMSVEA